MLRKENVKHKKEYTFSYRVWQTSKRLPGPPTLIVTQSTQHQTPIGPPVCGWLRGRQAPCRSFGLCQ